jgi:predicted nucleic acid-binding protein
VLTVDASVWVAALDLGDPSHAASRRFLEAMRVRREPLVGPAILLVETACALARRMDDAEKALAAVETLRNLPPLRLFQHEAELNDEAADIGARLRLCGADSFYAAVARREDAPLITWDRELAERAEGQTPAQWLAANS